MTETTKGDKEEMIVAEDYLITQGLAELFANRFALDLSAGKMRDIIQLEQGFCRELGGILGGVVFQKEDGDKGKTYHRYNYLVLSAEEMRDTVDSMIGAETLPIVSFDDVYMNGQASDHYSVTRLTDPFDASNKRPGPRPGAFSLARQVEYLQARYGQQPVAVFDVGVFDGETLLSEAISRNGLANGDLKKTCSNGRENGRLQREGINVQKIYLTVANAEGLQTVQDGSTADIVVDENYVYNFGDWIESRDMLLFDGRKPMRSALQGDYGTDYLMIPYTCTPQMLSDAGGIPMQLYAQVTKRCREYHDTIVEVLQKKENGKGRIFVREEALKENPMVTNLRIYQE